MSLPVLKSVAALRAHIAGWRKEGHSVGFVPTMGALHAGHLSLVGIAKKEAGKVVASVFVNPAQFAPHEDFASYPRDLESDARLLGEAGCEALFAPSVEEMYPDGFATNVTVSGVTEGFEGAMRPTHFAGVATVVAKLLNQVQPDIAVFGEKDYQQLQTIRRLVADLDIPVRVVPGPIVRESDGLAMSSRNAYLNPEQRARAGQINVILAEAVRAMQGGTPIGASLEKARQALLDLGVDGIDYVSVVEPGTLRPMNPEGQAKDARLLAVVRVGPVRLLDNMAI